MGINTKTMINFFRRIRKKLADDNKPLKYMRYAIGEILLVVVGILIALQINNWNEERKTNDIRQTYYQQILADINKEYAQEVIERLNKSIASFKTYREYAKNPNLKPIEIINGLTKVEFTFAIFNFNTKSIEALESTGDIRLMPKTIRDKLIDIKSGQELLFRQQIMNDQHYLTGQQKAFALGFFRLVNAPANFQDIHINDNITEIILTLNTALGLKNYTEKSKIKHLNNYLKNLNDLNELIGEKLKS